MGKILFGQVRNWQVLLPALMLGMIASVPALAVCFCPNNFHTMLGLVMCQSDFESTNTLGCSATPQKASDCGCGTHAEVGNTGLDFFCIDVNVPQPFPCNTPNPYYTEATTSSTGTAVTSAITTAITTATTSITTIATEAPETQAGTVKAAGSVALTGANTKANGALLFCAEGANREFEAAGTGADDIAACQGDFKSADQMTKMAAANGKNPTLTRDEALLNDEAALAALEKFQKNFGVDKDEYVRRMLASHGSPSEFSDMLSSKFSADKLDKLLADAANAQPAGDTAASVAQAPEAEKASAVKGKASTSLRDSLRAKLEAAEANRKPASAKTSKTDNSSTKAQAEKLRPAGLEHWINGADEQQEESLTIFDVVHQKLQSLKQRERI